MNNTNLCEKANNLPSSPNDLKILIIKLSEEVKKLANETESTFLLHDGKIAELIRYIKDNLSNTLRCMLLDMDNAGELDEIITTTILSEIELLKAKVNHVVNVKNYGVIGDGVVDDTIAIQSVIDTNPFSTIYFPKGNYKISSPIKTQSDNDKQQNIELDRTATIFTDKNIDCLFELGGNGKNEGGINKRWKLFKGGILDATNCLYGIKINENAQGFNIEDTEIINFKRCGVYIPRASLETSSDVCIRDSYISGKSSTDDNYGIYIERPDNKFINLRINAVKKAISTDRGGQFLNNVHGLYISYTSEVPANYNESCFMEIKDGTDNFIDNSFCDTFATFIKTKSSDPFTLTNSLYYSYLENVDITLFKFSKEDSQCTIKNNRFTMPTPKTKHKGIVFENFNSQFYRDSTFIIKDNHINSSDLFVKGDIINKCNKSYVPYWLNTSELLPKGNSWLKIGYTFTSFNYMDLKLSIDGFIFNMRGKLEKYGNNTYLTYRPHSKSIEDVIKVGFKYEHSECGYDVYGIYVQQVSGSLKSDIECEITNNSNPLIQVNTYVTDRVIETLTMDAETTI